MTRPSIGARFVWTSKIDKKIPTRRVFTLRASFSSSSTMSVIDPSAAATIRFGSAGAARSGSRKKASVQKSSSKKNSNNQTEKNELAIARSAKIAQTLSEARWIFAIFALLAIASSFFSVWLLLFFLLLLFCTLAFFRDPDRAAPADPNLIVAAADGSITDIVELDENEALKVKTRRVGIFLSIFDVH